MIYTIYPCFCFIESCGDSQVGKQKIYLWEFVKIDWKYICEKNDKINSQNVETSTRSIIKNSISKKSGIFNFYF